MVDPPSPLRRSALTSNDDLIASPPISVRHSAPQVLNLLRRFELFRCRALLDQHNCAVHKIFVDPDCAAHLKHSRVNPQAGHPVFRKELMLHV